MQVQLTRYVNATGTHAAQSWSATLTNVKGEIVVTATAVTAKGALDSLARTLETAVRAVDEMRGNHGGTNASDKRGRL